MTRDSVRRYLVSYDIVDDRRRDRVAKALLRHGDRLQYSVFVVDAKPSRFIRMRRDLISLIKSSEDSLLFCDVGLLHDLRSDRFETVGRSRSITDEDSFIV